MICNIDHWAPESLSSQELTIFSVSKVFNHRHANASSHHVTAHTDHLFFRS